MEYEIINGKKYKKCKENQIRNPLTRRCINKDKKTAKDLEKILEQKRPKSLIKYIKKRGKKLSPIKEETPPIKDRILLYSKINKLLNIDDKRTDYCLKLISKTEYKVGDILLKKQIGSNSINGIVFHSNIKKYEFASKLVLKNDKTKNELQIFSILTDAVLKKRCPHFPILYGDLFCNKFEDNENLSLYPRVIRMNKNHSYHLILTELANGDLSSFMKEMNNPDNIYLNTLVQVYLSLIFFYKETRCFHNDAHWDNFLYYKIDKGGYYHYEIFGENYYLENLGYLWVISDYDASIPFKKNEISLIRDFGRIIYAFLPSNYSGMIRMKNYKLSSNSLNKINNIHTNIRYYNEKYSQKGMQMMILKLLKTFVKNGLLKSSIKTGEKIINETPYKINISQI